MSCNRNSKNRYSLQGARGRGLVSGRKEEAILGSGAGDGNPGGKRRPEGAGAEGESVRKEEDPRRGAGARWESGGKGKPPRKKKRILKGEVKNLGNLPIKKVRTSMIELKEGELSCE